MVVLVTAYSKTSEQVSKFMLVLINQPTTALDAVVTSLAEKDRAWSTVVWSERTFPYAK